MSRSSSSIQLQPQGWWNCNHLGGASRQLVGRGLASTVKG